MGLWQQLRREAQELQDEIKGLYGDVNAFVADSSNLRAGGLVTPKLLPGGVGMWAGFEDLSAPRGRQLVLDAKAAGLRYVVFTPTNNAAKSTWAWQPAQRIIRAGMEFVASEGLRVVAGPWARASVEFMRVCGQRIAGLFRDLRLTPRSEWDVEGSYEVTFGALLRQFGGDARRATDALVKAYLEPFGDGHEELSATLLYFNRRGGDALLRHPLLRRAMIQVYSVILGGTKFAATSSPGFQPGTLQRTGYHNYDAFLASRDLDHVGQGLGLFGERERLNPRIPVALRLDNAAAARKASRVTLEVAHEACIWAASTLRQKAWRDIALSEMRFLSSGGIEESEEDAQPTSHLDPPSAAAAAAVPAGLEVHWDQRFIFAGQRIPDGWRRIDRVDDPMRLIQGAAVAIGKAKHKLVRPLPNLAHEDDPGTYTPASTSDGDRYLFLNEGHAHTFRGGKLVTAQQLGFTDRFGIRGGVTVFEHEGNRR